MEEKNSIRVTIKVPDDWVGKKIVAYFQATIAGAYAQKVFISNEENDFHKEEKETPGVHPSEIGKQFMNKKQSVVRCKQEYHFNVSVEHRVNEVSQWQPSKMKESTVNISGHGVFGIVISNDTGIDKDYNDCVVIISLYKDSMD